MVRIEGPRHVDSSTWGLRPAAVWAWGPGTPQLGRGRWAGVHASVSSALAGQGPEEAEER